MIGQTVSHYRILEELGAGGMGIVYKAEDTKLKRIVALKFLSSQSLGTPDEKTRFVHEAQAAASLDHPDAELQTEHDVCAQLASQGLVDTRRIAGADEDSQSAGGP